MDLKYEIKYHKLEENYWWFKSRRNFILQLLDKHNIGKGDRILEIGCSGGPLIKNLESKGFSFVTGIDVSEKAITVAKSRGLSNVHVMDGANLDYPNEFFEVVIASDILEHIKEDKNALKEWTRVLKPNGLLLLFVPAHKFLWSTHDELNNHYRRYTKKELLYLMKGCNFKVKNTSYWNFALFFPITILRLLQRLQRKSKSNSDQLYKVSTLINNALVLLLTIEHKILSKINLPIGISILVEGKKLG
jgi:2-polyprenyl-3-methyl-5-hydroxy-6-metoxy-1,4-benzoquinol methylase